VLCYRTTQCSLNLPPHLGSSSKPSTCANQPAHNSHALHCTTPDSMHCQPDRDQAPGVSGVSLCLLACLLACLPACFLPAGVLLLVCYRTRTAAEINPPPHLGSSSKPSTCASQPAKNSRTANAGHDLHCMTPDSLLCYRTRTIKSTCQAA
jgi:hypothetical protein